MAKRISFLLILMVFVTSCNNRSGSPVVSTFAGNGKMGFTDGKATEASFSNPMGIAVDSTGNVYVADSRNNKIRKIGTDGTVTTLAGSGAQGSADGNSNAATFFAPVALAADSKGNVYVADTHNSLIRKINSAGVVTTIAGGLTAESKDHPENPARFDNPYGITADKQGNIFFTDWARNVIRKISPDGKVTIIAGGFEPGAKDGKDTSASFFLPEGIVADNKGNLFIADTYNNTIRKMDRNGVVTTLAGKPAKKGKRNAGSKDGKGPAASFSHPCGIAVDKNDNVYVADVGNNKIRKITPDGTVTTCAGTGLNGAYNGDAAKSTFYRPFGVAVDKDGNIYIADYQNNLIRKLSF